MNIHYFDIVFRDNTVADPFVADQWSEQLSDSDQFECGRTIEVWDSNVNLAASSPDMDGSVDDFVINDQFIPVVTTRLREYIEAHRVPTTQWLPVKVQSRSGDLDCFIMNMVQHVEGALDLDRTTIDRFPNSWSTVHLRGKIRSILNTTLVGEIIAKWDLFRTADFPGRVYCSERFRLGFLRLGFTGASFHSVKINH